MKIKMVQIKGSKDCCQLYSYFDKDQITLDNEGKIVVQSSSIELYPPDGYRFVAEQRDNGVVVHLVKNE